MKMFFILLVGIGLHAAENQVPYSQDKIAANRARLREKSSTLWQAMLNNVIDRAERPRLVNIRVKTPDQSEEAEGEALVFYSNSRSSEIFMPVVSLLMIEDLCTAYAWLQVKGFEHSTIDEYLALLKYGNPAAFPNGRFPAPLPALGIPPNALDDKKVDELSLRLRNGAWAFILLHEAGHIRYGHRSTAGEPAYKAQERERDADAFALRAMANDDAVPLGAFLYWQASIHYYPNRGDFSSDAEWEKFRARTSTHPVNSERATHIASFLETHAAEFADGPNAKPLQKQLVLEIAAGMKKISDTLKDPQRQRAARELAKATTIQTLKPRRPSEP